MISSKAANEWKSVVGDKPLHPRECFYNGSGHLAPLSWMEVSTKVFTFAEAMPVVHGVS
jgi:hypothetical protein